MRLENNIFAPSRGSRILIVLALGLSSLSFAQDSEIMSDLAISNIPTPSAGVHEMEVRYKYYDALHGKSLNHVLSNKVSASIEDQTQHYSNPQMAKTLFVKDLGLLIEKTVSKYGKKLDASQADGEFEDIQMDHTFTSPIQPPPLHPPPPPLQLVDKTQGEVLRSGLSYLTLKYKTLNQFFGDKKLQTLKSDLLTLAQSMSEGRPIQREYSFPSHPFPGRPMPAPSPGMPRPAPAPMPQPGRGTVRAGGAQDFNSFLKIVRDQKVPSTEFFSMEGFMTQFDLSLGNAPSSCKDLICPILGLATEKIKGQKEKLFAQIDLATNLDAEHFQGKPLNIAVVLDISGSMEGFDGTELSRLDWAKSALKGIIDQLKNNDTLSLVVFDSTSEILFQNKKSTDKIEMLKLLSAIHTKGSTNLEAGLQDGYKILEKTFAKTKENRILLLTDAGVNTGETRTGALEDMVAQHAKKGLGMTAIGIGENFKQSLISSITSTKGGNYLFLQSGETLQKFLKNAKLALTPVAFDLLVGARSLDARSTYVRTYGAPNQKLNGTQAFLTVVQISSLFLAGTGEGGAILMEYEMK